MERHPNARSENGRGVLLLQRLTDDWGWREDSGGEHCKTVWFEIDSHADDGPLGFFDAFDVDSVEPL